MTYAHPLDRPVWNALTTRQAHLACGDAHAMRMIPGVGTFAAAADASPEKCLAALATMVRRDGALSMAESDPFPVPAGLTVSFQAACHQMVWTGHAPGGATFDIVLLGDTDAPEMLALATLTEPGPFYENTHRLGGFVGVKQDGRLVAMAGQRLRPPGFVEVTGVCTHPDHRGQGYAKGLIRAVMAAIIADGDTPFLHVYSYRAGAIALYELLGFELRRVVTQTVLEGS